jgi:transposase-like protein
MLIEQVRNGRRVADVAASVEVPEATVFSWVRQDRIDRGEIPGASSQESTELRAAKRRITELEAELAMVRRASRRRIDQRHAPERSRPLRRCR